MMDPARLNATAPSEIYTNLQGLSQYKSAGNNDLASLKQVAKQFESVFTRMLLKSMRDATEAMQGEDSLMNSQQTKFYQDMLDDQLSVTLSGDGGMGLADLLVQQLAPAVTGQAPASTAPASTGYPSHAGLRPQQTLAPVATDGWVALKPAKLADGFVASVPDEAWQGLASTPEVERRLAVSEPATGKFADPEHFVKTLWPLAQAAAKRLGNLDPRVLVAQAALETGWGKSVIRDGVGSSFNLFNIKADKRWQGERVNVSTLEYRDGVAVKERAGFRKYQSFADSFHDYVDFLQANGRYAQALTQTDSPESFVQALQQAGYATDPSYARKIQNIYQSELMQQVRAAPPVAPEPDSAAGLPSTSFW